VGLSLGKNPRQTPPGTLGLRLGEGVCTLKNSSGEEALPARHHQHAGLSSHLSSMSGVRTSGQPSPRFLLGASTWAARASRSPMALCTVQGSPELPCVSLPTLEWPVCAGAMDGSLHSQGVKLCRCQSLGSRLYV
jgi:hypothetical protein